MTLARLGRILHQRLRSLTGWRVADRALDDEIAFHIEQLVGEKIAEGLLPDEARAAAAREFGNTTRVIEDTRGMRGFTWSRDLAADLRHGGRALRRSPLVTIVAVASLGIGLGSAAAVAATARSVLWGSLPYPGAERLVAIRTIPPDAPDRRQGVTVAEYDAWRAHCRTLEDIGLSMSSPRDLGADSNGAHGERLPSLAFTPNLFRMLGVRPLHGRLFDDASSPFSEAARVMVISHRLWQSRYGGSPDVIGRAVPTDGGTRRIVGIMPPDFRSAHASAAFWIPLIPAAAESAGLNIGRPLGATARLRPGVSLEAAEQELTAVLDGLVSHLPDRFRGRRVELHPMREALYGWTRPPLETLSAAAALLLVMACANVTGLLLARGTTRHREIWARLALGAGRSRIIRQLLTESALVAAAGGLAALGVAAAGVRVLAVALTPPPGTSGITPAPVDSFVVVAVAMLSVAATVALGVPTAIAAVRAGERSDPRSPAHTAPPATTRVRNAIVVGEVALAMLLLVAAGLVGHSLAVVLGRPLNFEPEGLGSFRYVIPREEFITPAGFDGLLPVATLSDLPATAIARLHERLRTVPGIGAIGGMTYQPVNSLITPRFQVWPAGAGELAAARSTIAGYLITPGFFAAMRTPILRGRDVHDRDDGAAPAVAMLNESAARLLFADEEAVGREVVVDFAAGAPARRIVGVVADVPIIRQVLDPQPIVYVPLRQLPPVFRGGGANSLGVMTFVYRYAGTEEVALDALRRAAAEVDPRRPLVEAGIARRALEGNVSHNLTYAGALGAIGVIAALLAAIGVYGVSACATAARTREIAIRRALGAGAPDVVRLVARQTARLIALGLAGGIAGAAVVTPLIESELVGVRPLDPLTFTAAAALLGAVAAIAAALPVRRALSVEPARVLTME